MHSSEFFRILQSNGQKKEKENEGVQDSPQKDWRSEKEDYYYYYSGDILSFSKKLLNKDVGNADIFAFNHQGKTMNIWVTIPPRSSSLSLSISFSFPFPFSIQCPLFPPPPPLYNIYPEGGGEGRG